MRRPLTQVRPFVVALVTCRPDTVRSDRARRYWHHAWGGVGYTAPPRVGLELTLRRRDHVTTCRMRALAEGDRLWHFLALASRVPRDDLAPGPATIRGDIVLNATRSAATLTDQEGVPIAALLDDGFTLASDAGQLDLDWSEGVRDPTISLTRDGVKLLSGLSLTEALDAILMIHGATGGDSSLARKAPGEDDVPPLD